MRTGLSGNDIRRILRTGRRYSAGGLVVVCGGDEKSARCAIVISKKAVKRSVDRNTVRRRLREVVRAFSVPRAPFVLLYQRGDTSYQCFAKTVRSIIRMMG